MAVFEFDDFRIDLATLQLTRRGEVVALTPKAFDTLVLLVKNRLRVVPRSEIMKAIWPDAAVTDDSLVQAISAIRHALGEDPRNPVYVITVAKRGYRFVGSVAGSLPTVGATPASTLDPQPSPATPSTGAKSRPYLRRMLMTAGAGVVIAAIVGTVLAMRDGPAAMPPIRLVQTAPPGTTLLSGGVLSPDGHYLAFIAQDQTTQTPRLWIKDLESGETRVLPGTDGALRPFWSPDSRSLGFGANGRLKRTSLQGQAPQTLSDVWFGGWSSASWGTQDVILFSSRSTLYAVPASGGTARTVAAPNPAANEVVLSQPQFLPDGRTFLFRLSTTMPGGGGTFISSVDDPTQRTRVLDSGASQGIYVSPGYLVYIRDGALMAQQLRGTALTGSPIAIAPGVRPAPQNTTVVSASTTGLLAFGGDPAPTPLAWVDRSGEHQGNLSTPATFYNPRLSPNGREVVAQGADESAGIWRIDIESGAATRVVDGRSAVLSPDSKEIAFARTTRDGTNIYLRTMAGPAEDQLLLTSDGAITVSDWSEDGRYIVYSHGTATARGDIWLLPRAGTAQPFRYLNSSAAELHGQISPDGQLMAYMSDESGAWEIYIQSFPTLGAKRRISVNGGGSPQWRQDGRELYYVSADRFLMAVSITPGEELRIGPPVRLFQFPISTDLNAWPSFYAASSDGQRFLVTSDARSNEPITVIVNWIGLVEQ